MSDWLMATMPRLASRASLKLCRSASEAWFNLVLKSINELWRYLWDSTGSPRNKLDATDGCEERLSYPYAVAYEGAEVGAYVVCVDGPEVYGVPYGLGALIS